MGTVRNQQIDILPPIAKMGLADWRDETTGSFSQLPERKEEKVTEKKKLGRVGAIKKFFEADDGRKITVGELKELESEDREELANLAIKELPDHELEKK